MCGHTVRMVFVVAAPVTVVDNFLEMLELRKLQTYHRASLFMFSKSNREHIVEKNGGFASGKIPSTMLYSQRYIGIANIRKLRVAYKILSVQVQTVSATFSTPSAKSPPPSPPS